MKVVLFAVILGLALSASHLITGFEMVILVTITLAVFTHLTICVLKMMMGSQ